MSTINQDQQIIRQHFIKNCQQIRPQIEHFKASSCHHDFNRDPLTVKLTTLVKKRLQTPQIKTWQVLHLLSLVNSAIYGRQITNPRSLFRTLSKTARDVSHSIYQQQIAGAGLNSIDQVIAKQVTAISTFLIDLVTYRNLYLTLDFLDRETQVACSYSVQAHGRIYSPQADHQFVQDVAQAPSLFKLYRANLTQSLHNTRLTINKAQKLPNFLKFYFNFITAMRICRFMTDGKHNFKIFKMSAAECLRYR